MQPTLSMSTLYKIPSLIPRVLIFLDLIFPVLIFQDSIFFQVVTYNFITQKVVKS